MGHKKGAKSREETAAEVVQNYKEIKHGEQKKQTESYLSASNSHSNANVCELKSRGVIHSIPSHGYNLPC